MKTNFESRDNLIDITKFIASILVIMIHTGLFSNTSSFLWQFDVILLLAVPFYVLCSGYYFAERCEVCNGRVLNSVHNRKVFVTYIKKIGLLYVIWSTVYLIVSIPRWIETGWFSLATFIDWGVAFVVRGSYYHLWYLLFLIYAVIMLYFITRTVAIKYFPMLLLPLYVIEVLQYGYRKFLPEIWRNIFSIFDTIPCASMMTRVLPLLLLGMCISYNKRKNKRFYIKGFVLSLIILVIERNLLVCSGQENVSYIFMTLPTSYFFFQTIINCENILQNKNLKRLSQISTYVYVIHPLFIMLIGNKITAKLVVFVVSMMLSMLGSMLCVKIQGEIDQGDKWK